jgi:hypothetical protein
MGGTGVSYAIWAGMKAAGQVSTVSTIIAWVPAVIAVLFAFVKINGISLLSIVFLSLEKISKPARRVWIPRQGIYVNVVTKVIKEKKNEEVTKKKAQRKQTPIEELVRVLDQGPPESIATQEESEPEDTPPKPVKADRITAEKSGQPLDDITPLQDEKPEGKGPIFHDIVPPTSHA